MIRKQREYYIQYDLYLQDNNMVDASSFGSEFVVIMIMPDMIEDLQYKLRCFGVTVNGSAEVFCDNK